MFLWAFATLGLTQSNEIRRAQQHDSKIDSGYAWVPLEKQAPWLQSFPAPLSWKWGETGVGIFKIAEAKLEPFNFRLESYYVLAAGSA